MLLTHVCRAVKRAPRYFTEHNLKRIPGNLFSGKYRLSIVVSNNMKKEALRQILVEEQNLKCISRPYVTKEEDPARIELEPDPVPSYLRMKAARRDALSGKDGSMIPHTHNDWVLNHIHHDRRWE